MPNRRPLNVIAALQQLSVALALDGLSADLEIRISRPAFEALQRETGGPEGAVLVWSPAGRVAVYPRET